MNFTTNTMEDTFHGKIQLRMKELLLPAWLSLGFPDSSGSTSALASESSDSPFWQSIDQQLAVLGEDPATLFHTLLVSLVSLSVFVRVVQYQSSNQQTIVKNHSRRRLLEIPDQPLALRRLQWKFWSVFWLLRTSFWMSGPYFYAAYASKTDGNTALISQLSLVGYAAIALLGPMLGKWTDQYGRKTGTLAATVFYGLGSWSVLADPPHRWVWFLGRALGGIGTSLLSAAPEAWLVSAFHRATAAGVESNPAFLQQTFGVAYAYDSVCAIAAGQIAGLAAGHAGPTGPFRASPLFLLLGAAVAARFWEENRAGEDPAKDLDILAEATDDEDSDSVSSSDSSQECTTTIWDALTVIRNDRKILLLGGVQSFFEGAMYIFVMQWPPTLNRAIQTAFGKSSLTPYGTAFSCFMACCMAGSTVFGILAKRNKDRGSSLSFEKQTVALLGLACLALVAATAAVANPNSHLWQLIVAYFVFEACVGMYFPSIGTLRSKYLPDSQRSLIMTLFGVPLNVIVVTVFLFLHKLGDIGALAVAAVALGLATACMGGLYLAEKRQQDKERRRKHIRDQFKQMIHKIKFMKDFSKATRETLLREATHERKRSFSTFSGPQYF